MIGRVPRPWVRSRREDRIAFPIKPGLFLFAADERPPADVTAIKAALQNASLNVALNTGYRSYYDEMKRSNPAWNGFAMSPEQTFTIVSAGSRALCVNTENVAHCPAARRWRPRGGHRLESGHADLRGVVEQHAAHAVGRERRTHLNSPQTA